MLMHLDPANVHVDRLEDARDGGRVHLEDGEPTIHGARNYYDAIDNSPNGVFGDQTDATPEKGETLFEAATDELVALCSWLDDRAFEDLMAKPHAD